MVSKELPNFIPKELWPPNHPVLNHLDFCVWFELVERMTWQLVYNKESLIKEIKYACKKLRPETLQKSCLSWQRRVLSLRDNNGAYFQWLILMYFSSCFFKMDAIMPSFFQKKTKEYRVILLELWMKQRIPAWFLGQKIDANQLDMVKIGQKSRCEILWLSSLDDLCFTNLMHTQLTNGYEDNSRLEVFWDAIRGFHFIRSKERSLSEGGRYLWSFKWRHPSNQPFVVCWKFNWNVFLKRISDDHTDCCGKIVPASDATSDNLWRVFAGS